MSGRYERTIARFIFLLFALSLSEGRSKAKERSLEVFALLEVLDKNNQSFVFEPGQVLCSRERFRLEVEVSQRSYLWIAQLRAGKVALIYPGPDSDPERVFPGASQIIPDGAFELDDRRGIEQVFIVASRQMMLRDEVVKLIGTGLSKMCEPTRALRYRECASLVYAQDSQLAPDGSHERYRDLILRQGLKWQRVGDTAILRIPIVHR